KLDLPDSRLGGSVWIHRVVYGADHCLGNESHLIDVEPVNVGTRSRFAVAVADYNSDFLALGIKGSFRRLLERHGARRRFINQREIAELVCVGGEIAHIKALASRDRQSEEARWAQAGGNSVSECQSCGRELLNRAGTLLAVVEVPVAGGID